MREIIIIETREEYDYLRERSIDPLFYHPLFKLDVGLRIDLQSKLFGRPKFSENRIIIANDRFYHYCWEHGFSICENCDKPLPGYASVFVSHILSRSGSPELAHDPRNHNILCGNCHRKWESTSNFEMKIYLDNLIIIEELKSDLNTTKARQNLYTIN